MKDSCSEGVANHTDPESCGCVSNDMAEALAEERMGQVLSREIPIFQGADVVGRYGRQYRMYRNREIHSDPARSETLSTYGSIFRGNREIPFEVKIKDNAIEKHHLKHAGLLGNIPVVQICLEDRILKKSSNMLIRVSASRFFNSRR